MDKKQLVEELRLSLPSKKMLDVVRTGAVQINGDLIFLKKREGFSIEKESFICWDKDKDWNYDYNELHDKNVIFSLSLFGKRGQQALHYFNG
jgi:Na+-transporting NADH:ubiquinone oxidoreductase subunit NqrF